MRLTILPMFLAAVLFSTGSFAANKQMKEPSKEDRAKIADMHEKMADCLRSDKSMKDCRSEMQASCKEMGDACPMSHWDKKAKRKYRASLENKSSGQSAGGSQDQGE